MDEIQAAVLRRFLPEVSGWNAGRRAAADRYRRLGLGDLVQLPAEAAGAEHVYHLYVVRSPARDQLARTLTAAGIGCRAYYDVPLHLQPVFAHLGYRRGDLPETERAADEGLALPMFPTLDESAQREVVAAVRAAALAAA
jgi:dTDP-4-amino-4,6-dideoxygalactose transaminase